MGNQQATSAGSFHSKAKGNIGEMAIATDLLKKGYSVFKELGDLSRTDLVAIVRNVPILFQVKYAKMKCNGVVEVLFGKSGPGYVYLYTEIDFDVLAVYVPDIDTCLYISNSILREKGSIHIRITPSKNGQSQNVHMYTDFLSFEKALRDYTPRTLTFQDEGDEIVQTTTEEILASEN
jgi:hypothetical protein